MPVLQMLFWTKAEQRRKAELFEKARKHFAPVLNRTLGEQPAFYLGQEIRGGSGVDSWITMEGFVRLFGPLIEKGDYHKSSYKARSLEQDLHINDSILDEWQSAGCLLWD